MVKYIIMLFMSLPLISCAKKPHAEIDVVATQEANLSLKYEKKFGKPISDFELLTRHIYYEPLYERNNNNPAAISVIRTETGAVVRYKKNALELYLDTSEWLDFINTIHKLGIRDSLEQRVSLGIETHGLGQKYGSNSIGIIDEVYGGSVNTLGIYWDGVNMSKMSWGAFFDIMRDMEKRVIKYGSINLEALMRESYEKKFGIPITDFEMSIMEVDNGFNINVTRTTTGALARINLIEPKNSLIDSKTIYIYHGEKYIEQELDIEEWLDFINALSKCNLIKKEIPRSRGTALDQLLNLNNNTATTHIYLLNEERTEINCFVINSPSWNEIRKVLAYTKAKVKGGVK